MPISKRSQNFYSKSWKILWNLGVRKAIITHFQEGMSYRDIVHHLRAFDVTKNHVQHTVKKFKKSNSVEDSILDKPRSGRPRSKRSPQIIRSVRAKIEGNPNKPIRKMAREAGMAAVVVWRIIRDDLKYKSYKLRRRTYLTDKTMEKRLLRGRAILRILKSRWPPSIIWSDEKISQLNQSTIARTAGYYQRISTALQWGWNHTWKPKNQPR